MNASSTSSKPCKLVSSVIAQPVSNVVEKQVLTVSNVVPSRWVRLALLRGQTRTPSPCCCRWWSCAWTLSVWHQCVCGESPHWWPRDSIFVKVLSHPHGLCMRRRAPHAPGPKRLLPRPAPSCRGRQWFKTCYSLLLFLLTLASRRPSKLDPPHADTRSGIDASWLVCRGAGYPPRLRSSPRMAQASLISSSVSSFLLFILSSQN